MRAVVQRVTDADVTVENKITGSIGKGFVVLLGVEDGDTESDADYMVEKITGLRVFEDEEGKMNLSMMDVGGENMNYNDILKAIAKKYNTTPKQVETEMKLAIRSAGLNVSVQDFILKSTLQIKQRLYIV